jgi:hypothetical protein
MHETNTGRTQKEFENREKEKNNRKKIAKILTEILIKIVLIIIQGTYDRWKYPSQEVILSEEVFQK